MFGKMQVQETNKARIKVLGMRVFNRYAVFNLFCGLSDRFPDTRKMFLFDYAA